MDLTSRFFNINLFASVAYYLFSSVAIFVSYCIRCRLSGLNMLAFVVGTWGVVCMRLGPNDKMADITQRPLFVDSSII